MNTLNLAKPDNSEIAFQVSRFPDGQQSVTLPSFGLTGPVKIVSHLNSFTDLELVICANQALREAGITEVHLYTPYFIGARSDRKFTDGGSNYLKTVICPIINAQNFASVTVLDPHSDVLEACLNNFRKVDNHSLVRAALTQIDNRDGAQDRIVLVSPDAGAYKKVFDVAKAFGIKQIITATKVRDIATGKILHTEIPTLDQHRDLKYVIVDDICDGGRTFVELEKAIHGSRPTAEVYLVVTHGIFSAGFGELNNSFKRVFCTNSVKDVDNSQVTQFNVF